MFSSYLLTRSKTDQSFIIMGISSLDCSQVLKSPFVRIMLTIKNQAPSFMTMCEFCNVWKEEVNELKLSLQCLKITPKMSQFYKVCHARNSSKNNDWNGNDKNGKNEFLFAFKHGQIYIIKFLLNGKMRHFWLIFKHFEPCFWFCQTFESLNYLFLDL